MTSIDPEFIGFPKHVHFPGILMYEADHLHEPERMVFGLQYKPDPVD